MKHQLLHTLLSCSAGILLTASSTSAAFIGADNASATAYSGGWTNGSDGATGGSANAFGQWFLSGDTADATHLIGSSLALGGGSDINSSGVSFGLRAANGSYLDAYRYIDPAGLTVGQTFSIDLAVNFRGGFKGMDLRGATDSTIFNFNVSNDYSVGSAASGNGSIGNTYSANSVFHFAFAQTSASGGTWSITRSGGISDFDTGTYNGVARSIKLYNGGQGGDSLQDRLYVNNLSVIPEPAPTLLLSLGGLMMVLRRRR